MGDEGDSARSRDEKPAEADREQKDKASRDRLVDETEEESFPASDPPESYRVD